MTQPFLGLYMIVRDSEKTILNLLKSIEGRFDEIVIVDTGSVDKTKELISAHFGNEYFPDTGDYSFTCRSTKVRFANFVWVNDFAAARNYSFSLGTAKWRMWLDSDDVLELAEGQDLRKALTQTEKDQPNINVILMRYDYAQPSYAQDKWRIMRWEDGWRWEGVIHEEIVPYPQHSRQISKYDYFVKVVHQAERDIHRSIRRNVEICTKLYNEAHASLDTAKSGRMAYYLGQYALLRDDLSLADRLLREAGEDLGLTNLACYALCDLAFEYVRRDLPHDAIKLAGQAIARCPILPDGLGVLGVALQAAGDNVQAVTVFDQLWKLPQMAIQSNRDLYRHEGLIPIAATMAYLAVGDLARANAALGRVNREIGYMTELHLKYTRAGAEYFKAVGLQRTKDYVDYLVWENEIYKALDVLDNAPANIISLPAISQMRKAILDKTPQIASWKDYCRTYAAETNEVFDRDEQQKELITRQGRAQYLKKWASELPKDGPPIEMYVIGVHGGFIEEEAMKQNDRIHLTAADVNPNFNYAIKRLERTFPGRVKSHQVIKDHYDWVPAGKENTFDVVVCYEVIEHVPFPDSMVDGFTKLLKPGGELFLSTPVGQFWVEPNATAKHHWNQHLTSWEPPALWNLLYAFGFRGSMWATDWRILHLCHMKLMAEREQKNEEIIIWCPRIHQSFDPSSLLTGHLGGSEEAVVHLSRALARNNVRVTVYGRPIEAETKLHVDQDVLWRENSEFDPAILAKKTILVWRSPKDALWLKSQCPTARVINYLHDTSYLQG